MIFLFLTPLEATPIETEDKGGFDESEEDADDETEDGVVEREDEDEGFADEKTGCKGIEGAGVKEEEEGKVDEGEFEEGEYGAEKDWFAREDNKSSACSLK